MEFKELGLSGAWLFEEKVHFDSRGSFQEWFRSDLIEEITGRAFPVVQANTSLSQKGVLRGIHFSTNPIGQAKWVTCTAGAIWDVLVDLRPESKTFKKWIGIDLAGDDAKAILVPERFGHAFVSLEENTKVSYLLTSAFAPRFEFGITPFDNDIGIIWPEMELILSERDRNAPTLAASISRLEYLDG